MFQKEKIEPEDIPTRATAKKIFKSEQAKKRDEQKDYIPLVEPKKTTEIIVKPKLSREQIEIVEKIGKSGKKINFGKPHKKNKREKKREIEKEDREIESQETIKISKNLSGDSILIITEKPQAAAKISMALSGGKARKIGVGKFTIPYYEFEKNGEKIVVACAVGHLFSLSQNIKGSNYPIFDISWHPNFEVKKKDFTKRYYQNIAKLLKQAREIVIATDYDTEGEVIGYNIVKYLAKQKDAKRMKFSSLTTEELEEAYKNIQPTIDWGQAIAGETRHYLDWYYGINLSRALMNAIKSTGKFKIMSIGRVQGPTLKLVVDKEKEIQKFKPIPFWRVFLIIEDSQGNILEVRFIKDIFDKKELDKFKDLKNKECEVETKKSKQIILPPAPFDLTTLQTETYKFFSISPSRTLQIAQHLYLNGLISYPRTSSQKIPESINPKHILDRLSNIFNQTRLITRKKPVEGAKSDPAHPSIYPTGEFQELAGEDKKIYELIVKRFIACFCADAILENKIITAIINDLKFKARGLEIKERGWMEVYAVKLNEKELLDMNGKAKIREIKIEEDETKPPKRFSPASIISELEKRGLGTKATRANILETLYNRNYITDQKSIKATSLGMNIIESLEKHSPIIIDENLTRDIEQDMENMQTNKNKQELLKKEQTSLEKGKQIIENISSEFHKNEKQIGEEIAKATEQAWKEEAKENNLDFTCKNCNKGKLAIKYSPKNKRSFIACDAYPNCKTTYSLPPNGLIKKIDKICEHCKFPMLMRLSKGKKPWIFCFNPECPGRQQIQQTQEE